MRDVKLNVSILADCVDTLSFVVCGMNQNSLIANLRSFLLLAPVCLLPVHLTTRSYLAAYHVTITDSFLLARVGGQAGRCWYSFVIAQRV
jgi:hypothetical protein